MAYDPSELLTLADQLRLLARTMPEGEAKERLRKAFVHREIVYVRRGRASAACTRTSAAQAGPAVPR
jgi:hypothetical protein